MTSIEFHKWLEHHGGFYPEIQPWLDKQDNGARVLESWQVILRGIDLPDACRASESLYAAETQPRGFGSHPRAVKAIVTREAERRFRSRTGVQAAKCPHCGDTGCVSVFVGSTEFLAQYHRRYGDTAYAMRCSVACNCESGRCNYPGSKVRFEHDRHVKADRPYTMLEPAVRKSIEQGERMEQRVDFQTSPQEF